jgi:two-component system, sensor histidine kinase PdtaS
MRKWPALVFFLLLCLASAQASTIDSLRQKLTTTKEDTAKVWLLHDLARHYMLVNIDSSRFLLLQAKNLSEKLGFTKGRIASIFRLASNYSLSGDPKELAMIWDALRVAKTEKELYWLGRCYILLGEKHQRDIRLDSALYYYNLAEKTHDEANLPYSNWIVFASKGMLFADQNEIEKAEQNYREALRLTEQRMIRKDYGWVLFGMLSWYFSSEQWAKYSETSEKYLKFLGEADKEKVGNDATHRVLYFFDENASPDSKILVLKTILQEHETLGNKTSLANTWKALGEVQAQAGHPFEALAALKNAMANFEAIGKLDMSSLCQKEIAGIYEAQKDYTNAFLWYKKYQSLDDSLNTLAVRENMQELEVKYETGKMEAEITQQQLKLEAASLARRNLGITIGALALAVLGALGFLYFKSKTNKELAAKNVIISTALGEKELLLREIHHRVKNNLQVISSLLHLQSKYIEDEKAMEVMREGRNRVKSMALIHQDLYQNDNLTSVEVAPYLTKLTESLFQSYNIDPDRIRLRSEVDAPRLDVDTLIPLGLILNELVSNALKHAFPNERLGEVAVSLKSLENALHLVVQDNGVGFAEHQKTKFEKSFGFEMVKTFAAKLKAKLEVENAEGTLVRLVIPQVA